MGNQSFDAILELDLKFKDSALAIFQTLEKSFDSTLQNLERKALGRFNERFFEKIGKKFEDELQARADAITATSASTSVSLIDPTQLNSAMTQIQNSITAAFSKGAILLENKLAGLGGKGSGGAESLTYLKGIQDRLSELLKEGTSLSGGGKGASGGSRHSSFVGFGDERIKTFTKNKPADFRGAYQASLSQYFGNVSRLFPSLFGKVLGSGLQQRDAGKELARRIETMEAREGESETEKDMRVVRDFLQELAKVQDSSADFVKVLQDKNTPAKLKSAFADLESKRQEGQRDYAGTKDEKESRQRAMAATVLSKAANTIDTLFSKNPEELFNLRGLASTVTDALLKSRVGNAALDQMSNFVQPLLAGVSKLLGPIEAALIPIAGPVAVIGGLLVGVIAIIAMAISRMTEMNKVLEPSALQNISKGGDVTSGFEKARTHTLKLLDAVGPATMSFDEMATVLNTLSEVGMESIDVSANVAKSVNTHAKLTGKAVSQMASQFKDLIWDQAASVEGLGEQMYTVYAVAKTSRMGVGQFSDSILSLAKSFGKATLDLGRLAVTFANISKMTFMSNKDLMDTQQMLMDKMKGMTGVGFAQMQGFFTEDKMGKMMDTVMQRSAESAGRNISKQTGISDPAVLQQMVDMVTVQGKGLDDVVKQFGLKGKNEETVRKELGNLMLMFQQRENFKATGDINAGAKFLKMGGSNATDVVIAETVQKLLQKAGKGGKISATEARAALSNSTEMKAILQAGNYSEEQAEQMYDLINNMAAKLGGDIDVSTIGDQLGAALKVRREDEMKAEEQRKAAKEKTMSTEGIMQLLGNFLSTTVSKWSNYFSGLLKGVNTLAGVEDAVNTTASDAGYGAAAGAILAGAVAIGTGGLGLPAAAAIIAGGAAVGTGVGAAGRSAGDFVGTDADIEAQAAMIKQRQAEHASNKAQMDALMQAAEQEAQLREIMQKAEQERRRKETNGGGQASAGSAGGIQINQQVDKLVVNGGKNDSRERLQKAQADSTVQLGASGLPAVAAPTPTPESGYNPWTGSDL